MARYAIRGPDRREIHHIDDVRVLQAAKSRGLDTEPIRESFAQIGNDLDRDAPVEVEMVSAVDDAHAALAETPFELVFAVEQRGARDRRFETRVVVRAPLR